MLTRQNFVANPLCFMTYQNKRWRRRIQVNVTAERWRSKCAAILWRSVIAIVRTAGILPKLKDFPAEMGGSGQTMPE
jgi:hypothetical protein